MEENNSRPGIWSVEAVVKLARTSAGQKYAGGYSGVLSTIDTYVRYRDAVTNEEDYATINARIVELTAQAVAMRMGDRSYDVSDIA